MKPQQGKKSTFVPVLGNVILAAVGMVIALGLVEILLRAFPNWVPPEVRVNPPARRVQAFVDSTYDLRKSDGDLFRYMQGNIRPLTPDQDEVVAHVHIVTDANGFRNSPPEKETYQIVALGDSFTRASGVASPWTQSLGEHLGDDVLNLGDVGFGPQDELNVLQQFGLTKRPDWVILAYFEGNDLYDAGAYDQANPFIITRFGRHILEQGLKGWREMRAGGDADHVNAASKYRYPITITIDGKDLELAFFSYYVAWLSADRDVIESSRNYRLTTDLILQMRELSETNGARFLLLYVPSKEHVYLPYLSDADVINRVFTNVPGIELDGAGFLQFADEKITLERTRAHMDDQSHVLADFAAEHDLRYIDLTSTFQDAAGTGQELYYPFDTHWNQAGHDLAARTIAEYMEVLP